MIYLHPSILTRPATVAVLEMTTCRRAVWTGTRAVLVRPGHGTLNLERRPQHAPRPKPWRAP